MGDLLKVLKELISLIPFFPGWLRWGYYGWLLFTFATIFATFVWYTSPSTVPTRIETQARARESPGRPIYLQTESLSELKAKVAAFQEQGLSHMQTGDFEQAKDAFEQAQIYLDQALIRAPQDLYVLNLRGYMLKDWAQVSLYLGQQAEADELLREASQTFRLILKLDANDASAHNGLGSVYLIRGDLDRAEEEIRTALELKPDYSAAQHDLELVERLQRAEQ